MGICLLGLLPFIFFKKVLNFSKSNNKLNQTNNLVTFFINNCGIISYRQSFQSNSPIPNFNQVKQMPQHVQGVVKTVYFYVFYQTF